MKICSREKEKKEEEPAEIVKGVEVAPPRRQFNVEDTLNEADLDAIGIELRQSRQEGGRDDVNRPRGSHSGKKKLMVPLDLPEDVKKPLLKEDEKASGGSTRKGG